MTPELLEDVAARFKVLSERRGCRCCNALGDGP
jgi:hypothetical protein